VVVAVTLFDPITSFFSSILAQSSLSHFPGAQLVSSSDTTGSGFPLDPVTLQTSVADPDPNPDPNQDPDPNPDPDAPDPRVFGPPGSGSGTSS
jgi:hypothetical protein